MWRHVERAKMHGPRRCRDAFIDTYLDAEWPAIAGCVGCFRIEGPGAQLFAADRGQPFHHARHAAAPGARLSARAIGAAVMTAALCRSDRRPDRAVEIAADPRLLARRRSGSRPTIARRMSPRTSWPTFIANRRDDPGVARVQHHHAAQDRGARPCRGSRRRPRHDRRDQHRRSAPTTASLVGTNTDAAGFYAPIADLDLTGQPVDRDRRGRCGARGAVRAVAAGVGPVTILNRNPLKARGAAGGVRAEGAGAARSPAAAPPGALLVNASTLGMAGQPPLDLDLWRAARRRGRLRHRLCAARDTVARRPRARAISTRSTGWRC